MKTKSQNRLVDILWASNQKKDVERLFAEMAMGVLFGLKEHRLSVEQAEKDMFNMDAYHEARRQRVDRRLIEFLEWGMELEDVVQIAPENIEESYAEMGQLLSSFFAQSRGRRRRVAAPTPILTEERHRNPRGTKKLAMTGS